MTVRVSVVVPMYNEESTILTVLERVAQQSMKGAELEVIVVDDASRDSSASLVESRPDLHHRLIRLPVNRGKGGAVKAALEAATGDYVLFQDADLEYDPADYHALLRPVIEFGAEVVMGSRMVAPPFTRVHYFWHKLGNQFITLFFNLLFNSTFTDVYSCYLLFRRDRLDVAKLRTERWDQHAEILAKVARSSRVIYEVPVSYRGRTYEEGKKIRAHHALPVLWTMFRERVAPSQ